MRATTASPRSSAGRGRSRRTVLKYFVLGPWSVPWSQVRPWSLVPMVQEHGKPRDEERTRDQERTRHQERRTRDQASALRTGHHARHLEADAIDVIARGDVEAPRVGISERDVGRADLLLRLPTDDGQIERTEKCSGR